MARKAAALTAADYVTIGRRYGSGDISTEASESSARWTRDVKALGSYGFGATRLADFEALRAAHSAARAKRPEAIAAKTSSVRGRDTQVAAAWQWVDMVESVLKSLARDDDALAVRLNAAMPADDSGLASGIEALTALVVEHKAKLPADAGADDRIAESPALCAALTAAPGAVAAAKASPTADTADLDLLDGKLYVAIRDLNEAGRKAIRNGKLKAQLGEYKFHHLNQSGRPAEEPGAEPAPQPTPPAPTP